MKRLTEHDLKVAQDYHELKWYEGMPIIVAAFGETWKRLTDTHDYTDADYFVVTMKSKLIPPLLSPVPVMA